MKINLKKRLLVTSLFLGIAGASLLPVSAISSRVDNLLNNWDAALSKLETKDYYEKGYIKITYNSTNPGDIYGGTWKQIGQGNVLIGAGNKYTNESTGGTKTETITEETLPNHVHYGRTNDAGNHSHSINTALTGISWTGNYLIRTTENTRGFARSASGSTQGELYPSINYAGGHTHTINTNSSIIGYIGDVTNGGDSHNNLQPYVTCYYWEKISSKTKTSNTLPNGTTQQKLNNLETRLNNVKTTKNYSVGDIIFTQTDENPAEKYGGTWKRTAQGRTLVGVNSSDSDFQTANLYGGEKNHTLTNSEIAAHSHQGTSQQESSGSHTHGYNYSSNNGYGVTIYSSSADKLIRDKNSNLPGDFVTVGYLSIANTGDHTHSFKTEDAGNSQAHSNVMPYYTVYMWEMTSDENGNSTSGSNLVFFDANGGTFTETNSTKDYSTTFVTGESVGELPYVTRKDYHFIGWYTAKSGGTRINDGDLYQYKRGMSLYAHWEEFVKTGHENVYRLVASPTGTGSNFGTNLWGSGNYNVAMYDKTAKDGSDNGAFVRFLDAGDGYVYIQPLNSNKVYDVSGSTVANGANVWTYDLNYTDAQKWKIIKSSTYENHYAFVSKLNPKYVLCRENGGSGASNKQNVIIWSWGTSFDSNGCPTTPDGLWVLEDAATSSTYNYVYQDYNGGKPGGGAYNFSQKKSNIYSSKSETPIVMDGWFMQTTNTKVVKIYIDGKYYGRGNNVYRQDVINVYNVYMGGADYNKYSGYEARMIPKGLSPGNHTMTIKIYDQFNQYLNYTQSYDFVIASTNEAADSIDSTKNLLDVPEVIYQGWDCKDGGGDATTTQTRFGLTGWLSIANSSNIFTGLEISLPATVYGGDIEYNVHMANIGWTNKYLKNGQRAGTGWPTNRIEAMKVRLTGEISNHYDIYYRVKINNSNNWEAWCKNDEVAGTVGESKKINAIQITLVPKE